MAGRNEKKNITKSKIVNYARRIIMATADLILKNGKIFSVKDAMTIFQILFYS